MPIQFSPVIAAQERGNASFSVKKIDLDGLGEHASPLSVFDDFRVRGRPFPPHPHAGFSAVTYVFEDSQGSLRSRDSLGNDIVIRPGGIVWTQAGSGVIHHELPAEDDHELHGLQIFVNLSSRNKLIDPQLLRLDRNEIPEWHNDTGDRVRVVAGAFENVASPLTPAEPFTFLDVELKSKILVDLPKAHNALVYALKGNVVVSANGREQEVSTEHALALHGDGGSVTFASNHPARFLVLSGAEINEPVFVQGPFIMNNREQADAAMARYRAGKMGSLKPL